MKGKVEKAEKNKNIEGLRLTARGWEWIGGFLTPSKEGIRLCLVLHNTDYPAV